MGPSVFVVGPRLALFRAEVVQLVYSIGNGHDLGGSEKLASGIPDPISERVRVSWAAARGVAEVHGIVGWPKSCGAVAASWVRSMC